MKGMAYRENYEMQLLTESGGGTGLHFSIKRNRKTVEDRSVSLRLCGYGANE